MADTFAATIKEDNGYSTDPLRLVFTVPNVRITVPIIILPYSGLSLPLFDVCPARLVKRLNLT